MKDVKSNLSSPLCTFPLAIRLSNTSITGDVIRFTIKSDEPDRSLTFEGKVAGDTIQFQRDGLNGSSLEGGPQSCHNFQD